MTDTKTEINWGYNCLTTGIHHGRQEELWKMSLIQASVIFTRDELKEIVVNRIYTDAMIFVHRGIDPRPSKVWADQVKEYAENWFLSVFERKLDELHAYYASASWHRDVEGVIERVKDNRLNPHYEPLHGHDSINLLCRILGQTASIEASKEAEKT